MIDADVVFYRDFFDAEESDRLFQALYETTPWRQDTATLFGKTHRLPRLTAWHGDAGKSYAYSGILMHPAPWTPTLLQIKARVAEVTAVPFNSVLLNLYRSGQDSMGWHSDAESSLGRNPAIASVSLGGTRRFGFRHRRQKHLRVNLELTHGSVLIMQGPTQHYWQHQVPKTAKQVDPRINLTFRVIVQP